MIITELILFRFKRLALTNTEYFKITPKEPLQLILGINGSGKSSILQELTPLPANHQDYKKEGFKSITIEHNNSTYILKSNFDGVQKHNFFKNGEELNVGGTLTVQRDLVRQEFGITPDIHEFLIAQKGFHTLSPNERRQWFTKLSDVNYDYAISLYLKLKEKYRDVSGALKLAKKRLINETSKSISKDEQDLIQEQVNDLYVFIQHLMEYRKPIDNSINVLDNNLYLIEQDLTKLSTLLFKKKLSLKHYNNYSSIQDIEVEISTLQSKLDVEKILITNYISEFNKYDTIIKDLKLTENTNFNTLFNQCKDKHSEYESLLNKQKLKLDISDYKTSSRAFETVYDILNTVFISIPVNAERKYSKQKFLEVSDFVINFKNTLNKIISDLNKLSAQKDAQEHQRDHDKIECPKCEYKWSRGYDEQLYNSICQKIEISRSQIDEGTIILLEKENYLEEIKNYSSIYKDFSNCVYNWPILKPLWDYINDSNDVTDNPRNILNVLEYFKYDLSLGVEAERVREEVEKLNNLILLSEKNSNEDISNINQKLNEVEKLISESTQKTNKYNSEINKLQNYKKDIEFIIDLEEKIKTLLESHDINIKNKYETYRRTSFNELIKSVQLNLSRKEQILSEIKIQKAIIKDLENQIDLMEIDNESYKLLVKELSPTDGLIAQGLLGFIKNFVRQMNNIIKKIWVYPLQVISCGINDSTSVELDYKFPLMVQTKDNTVPDVSKGSSAMREVVDLAFKITSMKYLGLSEYPIFFDEPCTGMDSEHRISSMKLLTSLLDQYSFSQMFIISHEHAQYGSLTNAEICVLSTNNIIIPANCIFNKHIVMN